jgi:NhaP-type Na+/H+ or K+/H+ antiporter
MQDDRDAWARDAHRMALVAFSFAISGIAAAGMLWYRRDWFILTLLVVASVGVVVGLVRWRVYRSRADSTPV